ncbi:hypothetical protein SCALM49S_01638 [Streptomyces californicus]
MVVVPCSRCVRMPVRTSSAVPEVKEAPPPPWLCMSTKPGTTQWPVRSTVRASSVCGGRDAGALDGQPAILDGAGGKHHRGTGENRAVCCRVGPSDGYLRGE